MKAIALRDSFQSIVLGLGAGVTINAASRDLARSASFDDREAALLLGLILITYASSKIAADRSNYLFTFIGASALSRPVVHAIFGP